MPAPYVEDEAAQIQAKLDRKLEPSEIKQRPGTNGGDHSIYSWTMTNYFLIVKLAYLEGWKAYSLANEVFGFNGWSSSIMDLKIDFIV